MGTFWKKLSVFWQYLLPQHALSRLVGKAAKCRCPWFKNLFINWFIRRYQVNMQDAVEPNPENYPDFNSFFVRALRADVRPLAADENHVICPVDGCISQIGIIHEETLLQAKNHHYSLSALLGGNPKKATLFRQGSFATLYLAPKDYHRVHMPFTGQLTEMFYVPGRLFSVNPVTTEYVPDLFARNERVVCLFDTQIGPMAVIMVGAMIVASIETVWGGTITPSTGRIVQHWDYRNNELIELPRGAELGRFKLGSTVIVLFSANRIRWLAQLQAETTVRMGQSFASVLL
ncbi:MAG: archaetidylserine decarboxylase [Gammaproteobacteria bacterium]